MTEVKLSVYLIMQLNPILWRRMEEWRYSSTILNFSSRWTEWSASRPRQVHRRGQSPRTHLRGGWVGQRADMDSMEKRNISFPSRESNLGPAFPSLVATPTELSQLPYICKVTRPTDSDSEDWGSITSDTSAALVTSTRCEGPGVELTPGSPNLFISSLIFRAEHAYPHFNTPCWKE
jgi:hypothetical protein